MAKITSFLNDTIYLVQSGHKSVLIVNEMDSWNFGIDNEKNCALGAQDMLDVLNEPLVEDAEEITEEQRKVLQNIILKNPAMIQLVYGGWFDNLIPVKFAKELKKAIQEQSISKEKIKKNWDFFAKKYKDFEAAGIDPVKNKDARNFLDSILEGKLPQSNDPELALEALEHLNKVDPSWIQYLELDKHLKFEEIQSLTVLLNDVPKLLEIIKKYSGRENEWKTMPSNEMEHVIINSLKKAQIVYLKEGSVLVSGPIENKNQSRSVTFTSTINDIVKLNSALNIKTSDATLSKKQVVKEAMQPKYKQKTAPKHEQTKIPKKQKDKKEKRSELKLFE